MSSSIRIDQLADEVNKAMKEYRDLAVDELKKAVKKAGTTARDETKQNAPQKTGTYAKSWRSKTTAESSTDIQVTVYSP